MLIEVSAVLISLWLALLPIAIAYLIYRPYERALTWRTDAIASANERDRSRLVDEKRDYENSLRHRLGCAYAVLGFAAAFVWVGYVLYHWNQIGALLRSVGPD